MSKNILIALLIGTCLILFIGFAYFFFMYFYTQIQIADAYTKNKIFEQMEEQVKEAMSVESAVQSMEYALFYYPESPYQIKGSQCDMITETLRRNSVRRMIATLQERFPESNKGNSPITWIEIYGYRGINNRTEELDEWKESEWYRKWYDDSGIWMIPKR